MKNIREETTNGPYSETPSIKVGGFGSILAFLDVTNLRNFRKNKLEYPNNFQDTWIN